MSMSGFSRVVRGALATVGALALLVALPLSMQAASIRTESAVLTIGPGQTVDDDLYAAAGQGVNIQGTVNGNVFAAGNNTTIGGVVNGDVFVAGSQTIIAGRVTGNVYAAGSSVTVSGSVGKDLLTFAASVQLEPSGSVGRDALVNGGNINLAGSIGRNLNANGRTVVIGGSVGGNVDGNANKLSVSPGAVVKGNLSYTTGQPADVAAGSVAGAVNTATRSPAQAGRPSFLAAAIGWLRTVVGLFALGLLLLLLVPGFTKRASDKLGASPWVSLASGVALLLTVPFVALLAVIVGAFLGGWWLALALLALYGIALPVGYVLSSLFLAGFVAEHAAKLHVHLIWTLLAGLVVLTLAGRIPYVGPWISFAALVFGFGAFGATLAEQFRKPPAAAPQEPMRPMPMAA